MTKPAIHRLTRRTTSSSFLAPPPLDLTSCCVTGLWYPGSFHFCVPLGKYESNRQESHDYYHYYNKLVFKSCVVGSPAHGQNWERFYENSNGWHTQFPGIQYFTFDTLTQGSAIQSIATSMREKNQRHCNLLLTAFGKAFQVNPNADWYFLVEDDTLLVKPNHDLWQA